MKEVFRIKIWQTVHSTKIIFMEACENTSNCRQN